MDLDLGFKVLTVTAIFCAGTVCEIGLGGVADPETARRAASRLEGKYGRPGDPGPNGQCDVDWQDARFRRMWIWPGTQRKVEGALLLVYSCLDSLVPTLHVFYQNERAVERRRGDMSERQRNW